MCVSVCVQSLRSQCWPPWSTGWRRGSGSAPGVGKRVQTKPGYDVTQRQLTLHSEKIIIKYFIIDISFSVSNYWPYCECDWQILVWGKNLILIFFFRFISLGLSTPVPIVEQRRILVLRLGCIFILIIGSTRLLLEYQDLYSSYTQHRFNKITPGVPGPIQFIYLAQVQQDYSCYTYNFMVIEINTSFDFITN